MDQSNKAGATRRTNQDAAQRGYFRLNCDGNILQVLPCSEVDVALRSLYQRE